MYIFGHLLKNCSIYNTKIFLLMETGVRFCYKVLTLDFGGSEEGCLVRLDQNQLLGLRWQEMDVEKGRRGFE